MANFLTRLFTGEVNLKTLTEIRHPGFAPLWFLNLPRTKFDYVKDIGHGTGSSSIMGPVQWIQRSFSQAPLIVKRKLKDSTEIIDNHALIQLIENPNPFYSDMELFWASIFSWAISGNVYYLKVSNNTTGKPTQLWWVAPWYMNPKWPQSGTEFISHYEYTAGGRTQELSVEDIVHIRHGIDPDNLRLGISPLYSVMREVWIDNEASNFVAALLKNSGVPGVMVSPDSDNQPLQTDVDSVKAYFKEMFTGDRRGEPLVMAGKTKVEQFGFSPSQLDMSNIRNTVEERVCVNLGIPAAVVGFGTGLEQTTVGATLMGLMKLAWINGIIPLQKMFANEIKRSLLSDFEKDFRNFIVEFDTSNIEALQEEKTAIYQRNDIAVRGGWMTVAEARKSVGLDIERQHEVFLRPIASIETPDSNQVNASGKGNGHLDEDILFLIKQDSAETIARAESFERRKPSRSAVALIRQRERSRERLGSKFSKDLIRIFKQIGDLVANQAEERMKSKKIETKDETEFRVLADKIMQGIVFDEIVESMRSSYGSHYLNVLTRTFEESDTILGLATDLADPIQSRIFQEGGRRAGLIDLSGQTKEKLFNIISEASEAGEGVPTIARRIRDTVGAGPWKDAKTRADVVSITETRFAQNMSGMEYAKENGVTMAQCFDNRTGFDDEECMARDGRIVPISQAQEWAMEEHPQGTFDWVPHFQ